MARPFLYAASGAVIFAAHGTPSNLVGCPKAACLAANF